MFWVKKTYFEFPEKFQELGLVPHIFKVFEEE